MIPAEQILAVHDNGPGATPTLLHVYVDRHAEHDVRVRIYSGRLWGRGRIVGQQLVELEQRWPLPGAAERLAECVAAWTADAPVPEPPARVEPMLPPVLADTPAEGVELPPTKRGFFSRKRVKTDV